MKPENFAERKKMLFLLGALVAISILVLLLGLVFIYGRQALLPIGRTIERPAEAPGLEKAGTVLNTYASQLLLLDRTLSRQSTDSISTLPMIEKTRQEIGKMEHGLEKILDSLEQQGREYGPLVTSFQSLLEGHHEMTLLSDGGASGGASDEGQPSDPLKLQLSKAKNELRIKNDLITRLQNSWNDQHGGAEGNRALARLRSDYSDLQERFDQQEQSSQQLRQQAENLRHINENLSVKLKETKPFEPLAGERSTGTVAYGRSARTASDGRSDDDPRYSGKVQNAAQEHRTSELSDELRFAQVDCNLSRADARQMVYNAKQRKDLLTDALAALNDLARSQDPEVQKKARERIILLRSIASSVHD